MNEKDYNFGDAQQGAVVEIPPGMTRITIRIDSDTLNWCRYPGHQAGGGNYQTLINEVLREYVRNRDGTLEDTQRKVIREELQSIAD